jgi:two-component system sensor histidine kinase TctE
VDDLLRLQGATSAAPTGEHTDLAEVAREAADRWEREATRAGMTLRVEAPAAVPAPASGADLAQVLDNLIENAIRYGDRGGTITVSASNGVGGSAVAVSDTGPGIPADERDRVFERFYRGSDGQRRGPGTGLGLAIVGEIAGRWGGEARLSPSPEGGTRIEVRLPPPPTDS